MDSIGSLPIDMLIEILLKLSAKPLIRFKTVSRFWYCLISIPHFAKLHLQLSLANNSNIFFVSRNPSLYIADFDTFDNPIELNYPFKAPDHGGVSIIGYCNGLLCLWNFDVFNFIVFVFNPTTRTYTMLPYLPRPAHVAHHRHRFIHGFGYDSVADDYKFVRLLQCYSEDSDLIVYSELMVYSLRDDSWTKVLDHVPIHFNCRKANGAFVNGNLHWVIDTDRDKLPLPIASFNLSTYSFGEVPVPEVDTEPYSYCYMHVGELDGCLCCLVNYVDGVEISVMKEYGVAESWSKLVHIVNPDRIISMDQTIGFWRNKKELLVRLGSLKLGSIDLERKVVEDLSSRSLPIRRFHTVVCVENLLMLDYYSEIFLDEQHCGDNKKRRNRRKKKRRARRNKRH